MQLAVGRVSALLLDVLVRHWLFHESEIRHLVITAVYQNVTPRLHTMSPTSYLGSRTTTHPYPLGRRCDTFYGTIWRNCSYGWDNEYGSRTYSVPAFEANKHMVSNGEYAEFVKDAGYARRELWTQSGWGWKMFRNVKCPHFWVPEVSC